MKADSRMKKKNVAIFVLFCCFFFGGDFSTRSIVEPWALSELSIKVLMMNYKEAKNTNEMEIKQTPAITRIYCCSVVIQVKNDILGSQFWKKLAKNNETTTPQYKICIPNRLHWQNEWKWPNEH